MAVPRAATTDLSDGPFHHLLSSWNEEEKDLGYLRSLRTREATGEIQ